MTRHPASSPHHLITSLAYSEYKFTSCSRAQWKQCRTASHRISIRCTIEAYSSITQAFYHFSNLHGQPHGDGTVCVRNLGKGHTKRKAMQHGEQETLTMGYDI